MDGSLGYAEEHVVSDVVFESQFHRFQRERRTEDPSGVEVRGNEKLNTLGGMARGNGGLGAIGNEADGGVQRLRQPKESTYQDCTALFSPLLREASFKRVAADVIFLR